jgi:Ca2+/Na+ antiporter
MLLLIYVMIGYLITPLQYIKYLLLIIILIYLNWKYDNERCILTKLEHYYRTNEWNIKPAIEIEAPEFFRPFIKKIFNINLTRESADKLNYYLLTNSFILGFIRMYYKF